MGSRRHNAQADQSSLDKLKYGASAYHDVLEACHKYAASKHATSKHACFNVSTAARKVRLQ